MAPAPPPATVAHIVAAITHAASDGERTTEVALSPEELGRVRLRLSAAEGHLIVTVSADRTETINLLRRNIETLAQDLHDSGYPDAQILFAQNGPHPEDRQPQPSRAVTRPEPGTEDASDTPRAVPPTSGERLDMRI
jgi:flagellar hook-length control protein FliK